MNSQMTIGSKLRLGFATEITASSGKNSKLIQVIDEITFQTNILALNAAVEAAGAGEAEPGFAGAAHEVCSLAQRCAQGANDTADRIEDSVAKSHARKLKVVQVAGAIQMLGGSHSDRPQATRVRRGGEGDDGSSLAAMAAAVLRYAPPSPAPRAVAGRKTEKEDFPMETD